MSLPYFAYRRQTLFMAVSTGCVLIYFLVWIDPGFVRDVVIPASYLPVFVLLSATLYWTTLSLTGRWKRSLLWTFTGVMLIWLRINRLDSFINLILLGSFTGIIEYYWSLILKNTENRQQTADGDNSNN